MIKDRSDRNSLKETCDHSVRSCQKWSTLVGLGLSIIALVSMHLLSNSDNIQTFWGNVELSGATLRQHSCANCGRYTKTTQCIRLPQLETAKELVDTDLEKCNVFSDTERPWMSWMFSDKSVFEIPEPQTTSKAPREIPEALRPEYTLGGRINVTKAYYKQIYAGNKKRLIKWSERDIEQIIAEIQAGKH
eukprot:188550_1